MSFHKITIYGNLGKEPQIKEFNGEKVAEFSIATTHKSKAGEETIWFPCVVWGKKAEVIEKYVGKGSPLYVEGRLRQRSYTDKQGLERTYQEVVVADIQLMGKAANSPVSAPNAPTSAPMYAPSMDDDMPL